MTYLCLARQAYTFGPSDPLLKFTWYDFLPSLGCPWRLSRAGPIEENKRNTKRNNRRLLFRQKRQVEFKRQQTKNEETNGTKEEEEAVSHPYAAQL